MSQPVVLALTRVLRIQGLDLPASVKIEFTIKGKEEISYEIGE